MKLTYNLKSNPCPPLSLKYAKSQFSFHLADMDFEISDSIKVALKKRMEIPIFTYSLTPTEFFESIISWYNTKHHFKIKSNQIYRLTGVKNGIIACLNAFSQRNDFVLVLVPTYAGFFKVINDYERNVVKSKMIWNGYRFEVDFQDFDRKIKKYQPKIFILCSPDNPTGRVWSQSELDKIIKICNTYNVMIISDEIYMDIVHPSKKHLVASSLDEKIIVLSSCVKSFNIVGLPIAYAIIKNQKNYDKFASASEKMNMENNEGEIFGPIASAAAYNGSEIWLKDVSSYIFENYAFLVNFFEKHLPQIQPGELEGGFNVFCNYEKLKVSEQNFISKTVAVGLYFSMGSKFGLSEPWFRISIGCERKRLEKGLIKLASLFGMAKL